MTEFCKINVRLLENSKGSQKMGSLIDRNSSDYKNKQQ